MKKLFTLTLFTCLLAGQLIAQAGNGIPGFFELSVTDLPGSATNRAVVKARAISSIVPQVSQCDGNDQFFTDIFSGFKFALKYPVSSNITNIAVLTTGGVNFPGACPDPSDNGGTEGHHSITRANSTPHVENDFRVTFFQQSADPIPCPANWALNEWVTICTISITLAAPGCTVCDALSVVEIGEFPIAEEEFNLDTDHTLAIVVNSEENPNAIEYDLDPNNAPLPLDLLAFNAEKNENNALVKWTTANEFNTSHFTVQRSYDKNLWFNIGESKAAGFSTEIKNYNYTDFQVYNGRDARLQVYYRLNMVDLDGQQRYSPIQSIVWGTGVSTGRDFVVFPNPASEGVHVEWDASQVDQPTAIELYDVAGKLVMSVPVSDQTNQKYIDFKPSQIQSGLYLMRIMHNDEAIEHKQVVVGRAN